METESIISAMERKEYWEIPVSFLLVRQAYVAASTQTGKGNALTSEKNLLGLFCVFCHHTHMVVAAL